MSKLEWRELKQIIPGHKPTGARLNDHKYTIIHSKAKNKYTASYLRVRSGEPMRYLTDLIVGVPTLDEAKKLCEDDLARLMQ